MREDLTSDERIEISVEMDGSNERKRAGCRQYDGDVWVVQKGLNMFNTSEDVSRRVVHLWSSIWSICVVYIATLCMKTERGHSGIDTAAFGDLLG